MVNNLKEQMYRYRVEHIKDKSQRKVLVKEHQGIIQALEARDVERTRKMIRDHIYMQEVIVTRIIREQEK